MIRTSRRLADGREILYFDEDRPRRTTPDTRDLPPVRPTRSCATTPCSGSGWRSPRTGRAGPSCRRPTSARCAPRAPAGPPRSPSSDYQVVVFENRFPSLATGVARDVPPTAPGAPLAELRPGFGRCEVVCFTDDHDRVFAELGPDRARLVVDVWAERTAALSALDGVEYVFPFENHGEEIGVTLSHPHGQIYAYPYLPPRAERVLDSVRRHRRPPAATCSPRWSTASGRARGWWRRTSTGRRSSPPPPAGPTRCSCSRPAGCPTCRRCRRGAGRVRRASTSTSSAGSRTASTPRCPTSPPGTRRPCATGARTGGCTCSCSPSAGPPAS